MLIKLTGGKVYDPANGVDGEVRDILIEDGRIVTPEPNANRYGTLMGDGGYWLGIPLSVNAHSPTFMHLASTCGESPSGHHG